MEAPEDALLEAEPLPTDASDDDADAPASSGPASTPTSSTSSPPAEPPSPRSSAGQGFGPLSGPSLHSQSPHSGHAPARRGPGRPRKDPARPVRRYRTPMGSMRGFKRHRGSRDDSLEDLFDDVDLLASTPEEPPYFPEKWPGKVCALCNLSQRSQLGQGEMLQINCDVSGGISPGILAPPLSPSSSTPTTPTSVPSQNTLNLTLAAGRRQKNINKCKMPSSNPEHTDELSIIGYPESMEIMAVVDCGYLYLHKGCMDWSSPAESQAPGTLEIDRTIKIEDCLGDVDEGVKSIVAIALQRKCSFCLRWGASISCRMSCTKYFHYPCVLASGGFQEITTKSSFCKEHVYQVPLVCSADIDCHTCGLLGDIANLMTCCSCNAHHHGTCVGLPQLPGVRAGWNCKQCRVCQVCHGVGTDSGESKAIGCEQCDKLYHASCIRPIMTTIPKYGWKCKCCRVCSDCGSRSPGAGASSRWHAHYTVCDSCYQQRNKGLSCPLCRRAYRAAAQREMVQCSNCKRFVHGTCDADADLKTYQQKKETIPEYDYVCPVCTTIGRTPLQRRKDSIDDENLSASQESLYDDVIMDQDPLAFESKMDIGLGKGKPYSASKIAKKKIGAFKFRSNYGGSTTGKLPFNKRQRGYFMDFGRKRGAKTRMRGMFGIPGLGLQRPQAPDNKNGEDEPGVENKLVLCSSKDKFVLTQDVCVMCGALGTDSEGILIACAQCGQTYHPYCVSVKVTSVIVQKGWRCLDCTACEGCGRRDDEARLVLCDDCDVSFHTYCARPTLPAVPRGCWRCTRCRRCITCGTTQPGPDNMWMNGYTECGPCASLVMCAVCGTPYGDGELILQCAQCRRWLHAACDTVHSEQEADICCQRGYSCLLCRPRECPPPHLVPVPTPVPALPAPALTSTSLPQQALTPARPASPGEYFLDGVCLSAGGLRAIRALQGDGSTALGALHGRKKRRQRFEGPFDKSAGILATIESVVQGGDCDISNEESKIDINDIKEEQGMCLYKEGMIWIVAQDGPPPEGFTTYTTESGKTVLRRKRQRNLNRVGIGGFTVRVRSQGRGSRGGEGELPPNSSEGPDSVTPTGNLESPTSGCIGLEKRKKPRRKPRSRLMEAFPSYMQEAFFGRDLLDLPGARIGELDTSINVTDSEGEDVSETLLAGGDNASTINLNQDELLAIEATRIKEEKEKEENDKNNELYQNNLAKIKVENESEDVSGNDLHVEDVKSIKDMILSNEVGQDNPDIESITAMKKDPINTDVLNSHQKDGMTSETNAPSKEDMSILGVNLENMVRESLPNMDSRDVEEIFKGVLTDDSQESQESSVSFVNSVSGSSSYNPQRRQLSSPMEFPSPYHTEYSGSSQLSPAFSESSGQWSASGTVMNSSCATGNSDIIGTDSSISQPPTSQTTQPTTYNQRSTEKMKADEGLGSAATISAVLYANINYPEWKTEFPNWPDRCKQILKKWRALASDKKTPYLQQARDNRGAIRMKKAQQISKESNAVSGQAAPEIGVPTAPAELPATLPDQSAEVPLDKDGLNLTHASATNTPSPAIVPQAPSPDSNTFNKSSSPVTTNTVTSSSSVVTGFTSGHFTLNHQFMPFYHGSNGPAPNVTVNPFGKFTTAGGGTHHKTIGRSITPSTTPGPHLTLGIVQQAQAQTPAASLVRHNITGALFSQALSFLGKSHVLPHSISSIMHSGGSTHKGVADGNCDNAVRSRSSSPMSPCGDVISDSTPLTSAPASAPPSPPGDLHIRVLTPSEIMRTLPSMPQELAYEPPIQTTEQEKLSGQQRGVREAEQERQWKQLQQLRQQQQQHQQQVIHDQRLQAMARVQRQINTDGSFPSEQLQVSINEQSPLHPGGVTSHSPTMPRSPYPSTNNVGRFTHPPLVQARPPTAPQRLVQSPFSPQSPHDPFPGSVSPAQNQSDPFQRPPSENSGEYLHSPQTPRSFGHQSPNPARSPAYANQTRMVTNINSQENYTQPPGTPRPGTQYSIVPQRNQIYAPRPQDPFLPPAQNPALLSPRSEGSLHPPEVNRQLRDLLQRQQNPSNKIWSQGDDQSITNQHSIEQQQITEGQFRQPLPVSPIVRPRVPVAPQEPRTRLILQNTPGGIQQQQQQRMLSPLQQQQLAAAAGHAILNVRSRTPVVESPKQQSQNTLPNTHPIIQGEKNILVNAHQPPKVNMGTPSPLLNNSNQKGTSTVSTQQINNSSTPIGNTSQSTEEMPDMDIDKLEQDNANMAEVGDLLGGLGDDEEELLVSLTAEMGDDFNILEYADPELADFGDTSNILDGLELTDDSDTTQGKHVKRDPVEDSSEETKSNIKHDSPIIKAEKKEEEESTGDKRVKLEPNIEGETNENQSIQIIHQKQELVESGVSAQHVTLPRLDIIHSTQPQSSSLSQNPSLIQNQHMRFQQTFRTNIAPTHLQVQGKLQQSQPNQFGLAQKIGNRQMGQIINVNQQNQFNQMNINKQTAVVVGQQTNIPVNQNQQVISTSQHHQIVQQIIARQTDQSQSLEQLTQHSQNQVQFTPNQQQIRGQFVPPQQQLAQQLQQQAAIQQQMQSQVAAAIASGRPMAPGTRLMSPDGAVGVVTSNNSVTVTYPSAFAHHRPQHGRVGVGMGLGIRNVVRAAPPPPPPPYPGTTQRLQAPPPPPPPPYPSQISLEVPSSVYGVDPWSDWLRSRRPLLLQEQPLLLEDLVEQEKREQGRQVGVAVESSDSVSTSSSVSVETSTPQQQWQQPTTPTTPPQQPQVGSVPLYNIPHLAAPPLPPERITTDSDRQAQLAYEQWLQGQNTLLTHQLKYYETEVQKLRKIRKSLNSKQRQLRKSGNELAAGDAAELARISGEQAVLQKHLESARKQCRQHSMLIQEYRNKQQQQTQIQQSGGIIQQQINIVQGNITQQQSSVGQQQQQSNIVQQINVNQQQININQPQINTGQQQINTGQQQINTGKQHINTGKQINTVQQQINTVQQQINTGQQQINTGQQINMGQQINTGQQQINIGQQVNMVQQMNIGQVNVNQVNNGKGIFNQVLTQMQQQQSQQQQHQQQHQQHQQQHQQQQQQQISLMQTLQHTNSNQTQLMQQQVNQQNQVAQQLHLSQQTQNQINQQHGSIIQQQRINVMNPINQVVQQSQGNQQIQQISVSNQSSSPQMQTHLQIVNQQQQIIGIHQQNQLDKLTGNQTLHQINQLQNLSQGQRPMSSPSPQMTVQLQQNIQSPVTSHSPQLQSMQSGSLSGGASPHTGSTPPPSFSPQSGNGGRSPQVVFPRPQGSPLQNRFVRPPTHHGMHQQGMRVGVTFNTRQSSPLGSPQPLMSPGASQNETQRQQMMQRQQYSPMGQPPSSPLSRSPLIGVQPPSSPMSVRSPLVTTQTTPSPSPQPDSMSGGGGNPHALHNPIPLPPNLSTYRYFKLGLRGGSPMWGHNKPMKRLISNDPTQGSSNQQADQGILGKPKKESHLNKVSILKKSHKQKYPPIMLP